MTRKVNVKFFRMPYGILCNRQAEVHHLRRWKRHNKHGLLICSQCGWSWLKIGTAKINMDGEVECRSDCFRRRMMRMRVKGKNG